MADSAHNELLHLWDLVPEEWRQGAHGVQRYLQPENRPERLACFFRGANPGMPAAAMAQRYIPGHRDGQVTSPDDAKQLRQIHGFSYVVTGTVECVYRDWGPFRAGPGYLVVISGAEGDPGSFCQKPGLHEMSVHVDGLTGHKLAEAGLWDLRAGVWRIGCQPHLVRRYVELQRDLENHGISPARLLRQFLVLVDEVAGLTRASDPEEQFRSRACSELAARTGKVGVVDEVASLLGLSPRQFRRRFRQVTGKTPQQYLLQIRMARAEHLLTFCSVKETAARLGYSDPFVFSRQYKRTFGVSPGRRQADA